MRSHRLRSGVAVCAASLLAGCASYTPGISVDEKPTGKESYLYGRFFIEAPKAAISFDKHMSMGFAISCSSGETYTLRFANEFPLQVIRIAPSVCSLAEFVYTDADGVIKSRKPAPKGLMKDARFDAGKAYYLGDFFAEGTTAVYGRTRSTNWRIKTVKNDYGKTTADMKVVFPNLAVIPTEDRMIGKPSQ